MVKYLLGFKIKSKKKIQVIRKDNVSDTHTN